MPGRKRLDRQIGASLTQSGFERRGHTSERIAGTVQHQDSGSGGIRLRRGLQCLHRAEQYRAFHHARMQLHDCAEEVRAIGIAEEGKLCLVNAIAPDRALGETGKGPGLGDERRRGGAVARHLLRADE